MNNYLKYTGMGAQLLFAILAGYFLGKWVAGALSFNETTGAAFGSLILLCGSLIKIVMDVMKDSNP